MKTIRGKVYVTDRDTKIKGIKEALNTQKQELDNLRDYKEEWY